MDYNHVVILMHVTDFMQSDITYAISGIWYLSISMLCKRNSFPIVYVYTIVPGIYPHE